MSRATLPKSFRLDARHLCRGSSRLEPNFRDVYAAATGGGDSPVFNLFQGHLRRRGLQHLLQFCLEADGFDAACASRCAAVRLAGETRSAAAAAAGTGVDIQRQVDRLRLLIKEDALSLYKAFLAPEAQPRLPIEDGIRNQIVEAICSESNGCIQPSSFKSARDAVFDLLNSQFYAEFLSTPTIAKYQLDFLSHRREDLTISDIVYCSSIVFNFMEFMDSHGAANFLQFIFDVRNFEETPADSQSSDAASSDAMRLYEKYFSLQATHRLGFDDEFRVEVEVAVSPADGGAAVRRDCFERARQLLLQYLQTAYLPDYLSSGMLSNHIASLTYVVDTDCLRSSSSSTTVQHQHEQQHQGHNLHRHQSERHHQSYNNNQHQHQHHQHHQQHQSHSSACSVHSEPVTSADFQRSIVNFGRVDHLGRFHSDLDRSPADQQQPGVAERLLRRLAQARDKKLESQQQSELHHQQQQQQQDPSAVAESIINEVRALTRRSGKN